MYITILLSVIVTVVALEAFTLLRDPEKIVFRCELDMELTEPDEVATLTYRIRNTAPWPMMFVSYSFLFGEAVEVRENEEWIRRHFVGDFFSKMYATNIFLMPRRTHRGRMRISLKERGIHTLGMVYIETGDFLGLKSRVRSFDLDRKVVCTARLVDDEPDVLALGGLLGDISVRRFICEDPSLILGYGEYTGSEPMKSISWSQTAKTGRLMVKKHDFTTDVDVSVVVNMEETERNTKERCLSLVRTVCETLEKHKIPYAIRSNGDLFEMEKGIGRMHYMELQRRLGVSRFAQFAPFERLAERCALAGMGSGGCIVITPELNERAEACVARLRGGADGRVCVIEGRQEE